VELKARSSILIATINLTIGQKMRIRWLGAKIVKMLNVASPLKVNSNLGLIYVGVYSGDLDDVKRPTGVSLVQMAVNQTTLKQMNPFHFRNFTSPGTYSMFVTNNTSNLDFDVVVTGSAKLYLD
jgi:hypothetical protein